MNYSTALSITLLFLVSFAFGGGDYVYNSKDHWEGIDYQHCQVEIRAHSKVCIGQSASSVVEIRGPIEGPLQVPNCFYNRTISITPDVFTSKGPQKITVNYEIFNETTYEYIQDSMDLTVEVEDFVRSGEINNASSQTVHAAATMTEGVPSNIVPGPSNPASDNATGNVGGTYIASPIDACGARVKMKAYYDVDIDILARTYKKLDDSATAKVTANAVVDGNTIAYVNVEVSDNNANGTGTISLPGLAVNVGPLTADGFFSMKEKRSSNKQESGWTPTTPGYDYPYLLPLSLNGCATANTSPGTNLLGGVGTYGTGTTAEAKVILKVKTTNTNADWRPSIP